MLNLEDYSGIFCIKTNILLLQLGKIGFYVQTQCKTEFIIEKQSHSQVSHHCTLVHRIPIFVQQVFFSYLLADFNAKYGKLGVFGVQQFIFYKNMYSSHFPKILKFIKEIKKWSNFNLKSWFAYLKNSNKNLYTMAKYVFLFNKYRAF